MTNTNGKGATGLVACIRHLRSRFTAMPLSVKLCSIAILIGAVGFSALSLRPSVTTVPQGSDIDRVDATSDRCAGFLAAITHARSDGVEAITDFGPQKCRVASDNFALLFSELVFDAEAMDTLIRQGSVGDDLCPTTFDTVHLYMRASAHPQRSSYLKRICGTDSVRNGLQVARDREHQKLQRSRADQDARLASIKVCEARHFEEGEQRLIEAASSRFMLTEHQETARDCILAKLTVELMMPRGGKLAAGPDAFRQFVAECCDQHAPTIPVDNSKLADIEAAIQFLSAD